MQIQDLPRELAKLGAVNGETGHLPLLSASFKVRVQGKRGPPGAAGPEYPPVHSYTDGTGDGELVPLSVDEWAEAVVDTVRTLSSDGMTQVWVWVYDHARSRTHVLRRLGPVVDNALTSGDDRLTMRRGESPTGALRVLGHLVVDAQREQRLAYQGVIELVKVNARLEAERDLWKARAEMAGSEKRWAALSDAVKPGLTAALPLLAQQVGPTVAAMTGHPMTPPPPPPTDDDGEPLPPDAQWDAHQRTLAETVAALGALAMASPSVVTGARVAALDKLATGLPTALAQLRPLAAANDARAATDDGAAA